MCQVISHLVIILLRSGLQIESKIEVVSLNMQKQSFISPEEQPN